MENIVKYLYHPSLYSKHLSKNPFQNPPPYKSLQGELSGAYSRRINIQHRLVYKVDNKDRSVLVIRMWAHT